MGIFFYHIGIAIATFAVTNIDDLILLSLYFTQPSYKKRDIVMGQYLGVLALILISLGGLVLGKIIDPNWIRWLGLFPLFLGIKGLIALFKKNTDESSEEISLSQKNRNQTLSIALITFANGGDNIGVYTPLFATTRIEYVSIYLIVFSLLIGVWCVISYSIGKNEWVKKYISKFGHIVLPIFLIILGLSILQ